MAFICAICETSCENCDMAKETLQRAGTTDPRVAIKKLDPGTVICQFCQIFLDELAGHTKPWGVPRIPNYEEKYGPLDQMTVEWLSLNF